MRAARACSASSDPAIEARGNPIAGERTKRGAREQRVKAEAPPGVVEHEESLHEDEEDVEPGPLVRIEVESEPEVRNEQHSDHPQRTHQEAENERDSERK